MPKEFRTSPDFRAAVLADGSAGTSGQALVSQGSSSAPKWVTPLIAKPSATAVTVANTTTETSILTYTLPVSPATGTLFQFWLWGSYLNNSGSNRTVRLQFKLGATTLFDSGVSGSLGSSASRKRFMFQGVLGIDGASSQVINCYCQISGNPGWGAPQTEIAGDGTSAESLTTAKDFIVTAIHSFAATTISLDLEMSSVIMLTP